MIREFLEGFRYKTVGEQFFISLKISAFLLFAMIIALIMPMLILITEGKVLVIPGFVLLVWGTVYTISKVAHDE